MPRRRTTDVMWRYSYPNSHRQVGDHEFFSADRCGTCFAWSWRGGYALIVSGRNNEVSIKSYPPQANVVVHNDNGETEATAITPAKVSLKRGQWHLEKASALRGYDCQTRFPTNPSAD